MPAAKKKARSAFVPPKVDELDDLLRRRNGSPEETARIDREIVKRFQRTRATLILDMAGFSVSVQRRGIIHHLAKIHRMRDVVGEVTRELRGTVVKFEADNAFLTFNTVAAAVRAAVRINERFEEANAQATHENHIEVSIGIGYGPIILAVDDFYGDEVNLASKLGEDLAENGEVLLTEAARRALRGGRHPLEKLDIKISGVRIAASRLVSPRQ